MKQKAEYCLNCINKPCQKGCPLENDIPSFIKNIKEDNLEEAYNVLIETTVLSSICGRICPHNKQCQGSCTRRFKGNPVNIGQLEAYIGDLSLKNDWNIPISERINKKVAIIGSGPSSLTCASFLYRNGVDVTIYEKYDKLGGILNHSIPEFRLDKTILQQTINKITKGMNIELNKELGKDISINDLSEYDAIYLGIGANISNKLNIPGENLANVIGGNELLEHHYNYDFENKVVVINGGGNVAMDVARTIIRKNPQKVIVIYRRSEKEMPAEIYEVNAAKEEGIEFLFQTNILNINGQNTVDNIEVINTKLIAKENERPYPVNIEGTNKIIKCDYVIKAIGADYDHNLIEKIGIDFTENNKTTNDKIFIGGDLINKNKTVAYAARSGRNAAYEILDKIKK